MSEDTIEEGMYRMAQEKLKLEKKITGNEGKKKFIKNISKELLTVFKKYI